MSQRVTVPSLTDSPRAGIVMTVPPDAAGAAGVGAGGATGVGEAGVGTGGGVGEAGATATGAGEGVEAPALSAITASSAPTATV